MAEPSAWKQPALYGSILGVLIVLNSLLPMAAAAALQADGAGLVGMASKLAGIALFLIGVPSAGALAVRGRAREMRDHSRYALTVGEGAGVGARTGLVATAWLVLGMLLGFAAGAVLGLAGQPATVGAGEVANLVGAGFAATACTAVCSGIFYAAVGAVGGSIGVPLFARAS